MNLFGWIYLVIVILAAMIAINEIDKPREPRTRADASLILLFSGLIFWALYVWGIR